MLVKPENLEVFVNDMNQGALCVFGVVSAPDLLFNKHFLQHACIITTVITFIEIR